MKKYIFTSLLMMTAVIVALAQQEDQMITVTIRNSSLLPKKITVISYQPGETGNGTTGVMLWPVGSRKFKFKEGTKIYIATDEQVGTVMSGKRIDQDKPFLVVTKASEGKSFEL
jgi:hypothetical protein